MPEIQDKLHLFRLMVAFGVLSLAAPFARADAVKPRAARPVIARHYKEDAPPPSGLHVALHQKTGVLVPRAQYRSVRRVGMELLRALSPRDHYYLLLGHSPGRIGAFLEALSPDLFQMLPAGGLGRLQNKDGVMDHYGAYGEHFQAMLPDSVVRGRRKILLIDYSSGASLNNLAYVLRHYLQEVGSKALVETVSFYPPAQNVDHKLTHGDVAPPHYLALDLDEISQYAYTHHHIGKHPLNDLRIDQTRWPQRVANYKEWMAQDAELDRFIREHLAEFL